jgi:hypothetical protein
MYLKAVNDILTNDSKIWMKIAINIRLEHIYFCFLNYFTDNNGISGLEKSYFA